MDQLNPNQNRDARKVPTAQPAPVSVPLPVPIGVPPAVPTAVPLAVPTSVPQAAPIVLVKSPTADVPPAPTINPAAPAATPVARPVPVAQTVSNNSPSTATGTVAAKKAANPLRPIPVQTDAHTVSEYDEEASPEEKLLKATPPWLVSLVVHCVLLLILALLVIPKMLSETPISLKVVYSEDIGQQLEEMPVEIAETNATEQEYSPTEQPPVENPLAVQPTIDFDPLGNVALTEMTVPNVGLALTGRESGMKKALLAAYGGNASTQEAVQLGLRWLKRQQNGDGSWSLNGPYSDGAIRDNKTAATAMALLAFLGDGHTHIKSGPYQDVVKKGWLALKRMQKKNGDFWNGGITNHRLYSQAQATIAVCELYAMTEDSEIRDAAQRAIDYAVDIQDSLGGWRYQPGVGSDLSVTGWFVMGLQSARMGKLQVPQETMDRVAKYLDRVSDYDGARYGYRTDEITTPSMTAEALLCRQYLGWPHGDARLNAGCKYLSINDINWSQADVYYWYYATQVMHHMEGDFWDDWNRTMKQVIPTEQVKSGREKGSWYPETCRWSAHGGRLFSTCLCIYMLEVYYRHMPIYADAYRGF